MALEMVLNDLSLSDTASNTAVARSRMSDLIQTVRAATVLGMDRVVRTNGTFGSQLLAPEYVVDRWRNDPLVDREERRFFSLLLQKAPYLTDDDDLGRFVDQLQYEFKFEGQEALGLQAAFILDALAVSLLSLPSWNADTLTIELNELKVYSAARSGPT